MLYLLLLFLSVGAFNELYPYTLIDTPIACNTTQDCVISYNHTWCRSTGVVCIQRHCRLIPDYPCKATETCLEETQRCAPILCKESSECDNGVYCDGVEVCVAGRCETDTARPNCYYMGGQCNETIKRCNEPKARVAWRASLKKGRISVKATTSTTDTSIITQLQVDVTALILVASFLFFVLFIILTYMLANSIRAGYTKKRYV